MARTTKKQEVTPVVTRAEKKDATKNLIREFLQKQQYKHNDLIDEVAKAYTERFSGEDTDNINDVKGRVGSVLDIMKKDGDVTFDGGVYAMKREEKPEKTMRRTKKAVAKETPKETTEEAPKKTVKRTTKKTAAKKEEKETPSEEKKAEETEEVLPLPPAPLQPIAPVAPITPEVAPEPLPEKPKKAVKRTTKKAAAKTVENTEEKVEEKPQEVAESKTEAAEIAEAAKSQPEEKQPKPVKTEEKPAEKPAEKLATVEAKPLMDMSFLFGDPKAKPTPKKQPEKAEKAEKAETPVPPQQQTKQQPQQKQQPKLPQKTGQKKEEVAVKPVEQKPVEKKEATTVQKPVRESVRKVKKPAPKAMTADEKLKEAFLKRMRQLGGDYFEYYSVYLLEKYSRRNGRRLESLKITGGDRDGGIDGEIELTDKLGFRETIYIQSKNWDPDKGDEKLWVVGETLVQQFIGACVCRQAKDKKQHCRGIFITTSRFTPDAKSMLDEMSDKVVGYDGNDLYETAKECEFGLVKKNGEWSLDEELLSGSKAFFNMI